MKIKNKVNEKLDNFDKIKNVQAVVDPVTANAIEFNKKKEKIAKQAFKGQGKEFDGAPKQPKPKKVEVPKSTLEESLFEDVTKINESTSVYAMNENTPLTEDSYGWSVDPLHVQEAYDEACEYFGEDDLNAQIVGCLSSDELKDCLDFIFRMNDFRECSFLESLNESESKKVDKTDDVIKAVSMALNKYDSDDISVYVNEDGMLDVMCCTNNNSFPLKTNIAKATDVDTELLNKKLNELDVADLMESVESEADKAQYKENPEPFISDMDKMRDYFEISKEDFLNSYSYMTEEEYDATTNYLNDNFKSIEDAKNFFNTLTTQYFANHPEEDATKIEEDCCGQCQFESDDKAKVDEETLNEAPIYDLQAQNDNRKSFYGKAKVDVDEKNEPVLYSYNTPVCKIKDGKVELMNQWNTSVTTLRHVKEFLKQNGFKADSRKQMEADYINQ